MAQPATKTVICCRVSHTMNYNSEQDKLTKIWMNFKILMPKKKTAKYSCQAKEAKQKWFMLHTFHFKDSVCGMTDSSGAVA